MPFLNDLSFSAPAAGSVALQHFNGASQTEYTP